jgi:hypothetical protein
VSTAASESAHVINSPAAPVGHATYLTDINLKIWRQSGPNARGHFENYRIDRISDEASFLEMLDVLNEKLISEGERRSCSTTTAAKASAGRAR